MKVAREHKKSDSTTTEPKLSRGAVVSWKKGGYDAVELNLSLLSTGICCKNAVSAASREIDRSRWIEIQSSEARVRERERGAS